MYTKIKPSNSAYIYYFRPEVYRRIHREQKTSVRPLDVLYMEGSDFVVDWYNGKIIKSIVDVESIMDKWCGTNQK